MTISGKLVPLFLLTVSAVNAQATDPAEVYKPITAEERVKWFGNASFGPAVMALGAINAGLGTWRNAPNEWGPHWDGFGERYGSGVGRRVVSKGVEAGLGSMWGEDPRYRRLGEAPVMSRVRNVAKMTVMSYDRNGHMMPAYARYAGITASSFASSYWLPSSQSEPSDARTRIMVGFAGNLVGNAAKEFWPDLGRKFRRHRSSDELSQITVK